MAWARPRSSRWRRIAAWSAPTASRVFARYSATRDAAIRDLPEGLIDPWLKVLSFWDGARAVAAISAYATHPMSYYGSGAISADFVGLARAQRQKDEPDVHQIYVSGCSGDVTAGKYNDGSPEGRVRLTERMHQAMAEAWKATTRRPLESIGFRSVPLVLPHREGRQTAEALRAQLADSSQSLLNRGLAAMGLSSRAASPGRPRDRRGGHRLRRGPDRAAAGREPGGLSTAGAADAARSVRDGDRLRRVLAGLHSDRRGLARGLCRKPGLVLGRARGRKPDGRRHEASIGP